MTFAHGQNPLKTILYTYNRVPYEVDASNFFSEIGRKTARFKCFLGNRYCAGHRKRPLRVRKHPKMDRMDGRAKELWLRIGRKKPYGWSVTSVDMKKLRKTAYETQNPTWFIISNEQVAGQPEYYLILRAYGRDRIPSD